MPMDFFDLIFRVGPGLQTIMKLGFLPKKEDFHELTSEQYLSYYRQYKDEGEKLFVLISGQHTIEFDDIKRSDLPIVSDQEMYSLLDAVTYIETQCKEANYPLPDDKAKIQFVAARLPDVFSKGTPFENSSPMNVV